MTPSAHHKHKKIIKYKKKTEASRPVLGGMEAFGTEPFKSKVYLVSLHLCIQSSEQIQSFFFNIYLTRSASQTDLWSVWLGKQTENTMMATYKLKA